MTSPLQRTASFQKALFLFFGMIGELRAAENAQFDEEWRKDRRK
jgi:hypothetical protein